jgi:hypothetical protein
MRQTKTGEMLTVTTICLIKDVRINKSSRSLFKVCSSKTASSVSSPLSACRDWEKEAKVRAKAFIFIGLKKGNNQTSISLNLPSFLNHARSRQHHAAWPRQLEEGAEDEEWTRTASSFFSTIYSKSFVGAFSWLK